MNSSQQQRSHWQYILMVVIIGAVVGGGILGCQYRRSPAETTKMPEIEEPGKVTKDETAKWTIYRDERHGYELRYPEGTITVSEAGQRIVMSHSIPFEHPDPCDFRGDAPPRRTLTDFEVTVEVISQSLRETVITRESEFTVSNFLLDGKLRIEPGFVDEMEIGSLHGYRITSGVEGCGEYTYYFPLTLKKTLVVKRSFITELQPIIADYEKYLKLPGVIPPDAEDSLFNQILSTFRFWE